MSRLAYKTANYRPDERLVASLESLLLIEVIHIPMYVHINVVRVCRAYALLLDCKNAASVQLLLSLISYDISQSSLQGLSWQRHHKIRPQNSHTYTSSENLFISPFGPGIGHLNSSTSFV